MNDENEVQRLVKRYGLNELARRLAVSPSSIKNWKKGKGTIPLAHRYKLQVIETGGYMKPAQLRRDGLPFLPKNALGIFPKEGTGKMRPMTELALFKQSDFPNGHTNGDYEGSIIQMIVLPALKALEK